MHMVTETTQVFHTSPLIMCAPSKVRIETVLQSRLDDESENRIVNAVLNEQDKPIAEASSVITVKQWDENTLVQYLELETAKLWSPDSPYMYRVRTSLYNSGNVIHKQIRYGRTHRFL